MDFLRNGINLTGKGFNEIPFGTDVQKEAVIEEGLGIPSVTGKEAVQNSDRILQDLSALQKPNALIQPNGNLSPLEISAINLVSASGYANYASNMKQLAVFNPTTRIIKIALDGNIGTSAYVFIVNANKLAVLPPINFDVVNWLQETYTASSINPLLIAYSRGDLAPSVSSIT